MAPTRYIVGIDLGTTNTAVAFADLDTASKKSRTGEHYPVRVLEIPQLVAAGELGGRSTLPSFVYLAGEHDLPQQATSLPWDLAARVVVGELARSQGARVPGRMVASAKSWLCHPGVDRHAAILPWGSADGSKLSPVDASARVLIHVAAAWESKMGTRLADAEVILTVPASFDEVARELTLEAATKAGLTHVTLLEEPQAVFYAWIDSHDPFARKKALAAGETVIVCDVGGGTTDFTRIDVAEDGDNFTRTAVGDHLLLGGDNIDIALARRVEGRLTKLDAVSWHGLVHACRMAKEAMLSDESIASLPITVAARGSRLIGGTLKTELGRAEIEELVLGGFFPLVSRDEVPTRARVGLHELGLPFAADPAITRHFAAFLSRHHVPRVDAVLFNGGAMKPPRVRGRVLDQVAAWQGGSRPHELPNDAPELAVARGAAYYGLVRHGHGSRIRGGAARACYVGVEGGGAVCVLPRGAEEGTERELDEDFALVMNRPVSVRLYSASARSDEPGTHVERASEELAELPPLVTVLRSPGRAQARVRIRARLTELGTLELWCCEKVAEPGGKDAPRWRLAFDLRGGGGPAAADDSAPSPKLAEAKGLVHAIFDGNAGAPPPALLVKELERVLDARRDEWTTSTIRALWDAANEREAGRGKSADAEARWLNFAGFCLRPGTGAPLDDWRAKEMWKVWGSGLRHEKDEACRLAWWILWRRIAGGLKRGQQEQVFDRIASLFLPSDKQKSKWFKLKPSLQEATEMWRAMASLERLVPSAKAKLGDVLLARLEKGGAARGVPGWCEPEVAYWALGRLGARVPLYGPADCVVALQVAEHWLQRLLALDWASPEKVAFSIAQIGRRTGDRGRDIDDATRSRVSERLRAIQGGERTARLVDEVIELEAREERVAFGDSLPTGLRRLDPDL
ncbi:MAG: hsp70 family protein [Deltaproteobacteria bacterium]|nr:hsp70 family protein [Deltaproteobacteria bacterium]